MYLYIYTHRMYDAVFFESIVAHCISILCGGRYVYVCMCVSVCVCVCACVRYMILSSVSRNSIYIWYRYLYTQVYVSTCTHISVCTYMGYIGCDLEFDGAKF